MSKQKIIFGLIASLLLVGCATKRLTEEDVAKKVEKAREANATAQEKVTEALSARNQYTADYKVAQIEIIDKRLKGIDKQIKSIEKSGKNGANDAVTSSLDNAIDALKNEKNTLNTKKKNIQNIQGENWQDNIAEIDSVMKIVTKNLNEINSSFEKLPE